ncbi:tetratricopeptide repeat protein 29 [Hippoglossus hippoglossus]|uniref:tetratricopeptide repeat protein 29 n=1 Tax=Hippoglossus hippoglossus TaxID=8267 RepID=UPI00148BBBE5|nr:tetratricopeptide repeat protein 29 [Hippoglossus hippoglossus]XP_034424804.1 tetratricopeptide repeat protein 29 [Hippoglossus hippoglossus]XP_034424805.1 tetratricopeptide repeat protein 29 [Hippoglossus hippoglossus]
MKESVSDESAQVASKEEISQFRNSLKQNICVQMLQEGHHRSFSELFSLLRSDQHRRAAEPGSALQPKAPLEEQREKLRRLKLHLGRAEQAERTGSWSVVCEQRLFLGRYFSAPEDQWLSLHFYQSCADRGCSRPATEARACMAELYLQQGELEEAKQQAELCVRQAEDGGWLDLSGRPLRLRACETLWRIYDTLAAAPLIAANYTEALELLNKGYIMATESEDKQLEGEAAYRLGLTYQLTGDHNTAKKFLNTCMQICGTTQDADGLGKAYKAMAKSIESEGNTDETVHCLEKLVDITRSTGQQDNLADACLCLGNIYYNTHQYSRACEFFLQGFEVACGIGNVDLLQKAQVLLGCARAQSRKYSVESASPAAQ